MVLRRLGVVLAFACSGVLLLGGGELARAQSATPTLVPVGTFAAPVYVTAPAGDTERLFVVERAGRIQLLEDGVKYPFLDISSLVACCEGERGLASMAFAPDYATSGLFYVFYTALNPRGELTVAEYRRSDSDPRAADPASARVVLTVPHDADSNHNGGQLQFGPDGYLYIGTGDGGGRGDPAGNAQNLTSSDPAVVNGINHHPLLGKLLRIDPRSGSPYAIPAGNPFPAPAGEVFAYGLRNPWRFSFDRVTGDLAIGDVGQDAYEEVDLSPAPGLGLGANYGWDIYEGFHIYPTVALAGPPFPPGFVFPVLEKSQTGDGFCAITGGYVVRDPALPELAGQYVYGDFCNPRLRAVTLTPTGAINDQPLPLSVSMLASFGEDGCGRVYAVSLSGAVYRLATSGACAGPSIPFSRPAVSVGDATVSEGDSGTAGATFQVSLSSPSASTVSVDFRTADGTAAAPGDYVSASGTLSFAPGETSKTITVPVVGDTVDEPDESFSVDLANAANASIADGAGVGTIVDDDAAPALSIGDATVSEGDSGSSAMTFTVALAGETARTVTVDYRTADGSATAPDDYAGASGTLAFAPGETSRTITVAVAGDTVDEPDESFSVDLANAVNASIADGAGAGTIVDDDAAPAVSIGDATATEGDSGTAGATFQVSLSGPSASTVTVDYRTADESATAPDDYVSASGTLSFAPGETSKTIMVAVVGDTVDEPDETFLVGVSNAGNASIADGAGIGTIVDDDQPPAPGEGPAISIRNVRVKEGDGGTTSATFRVSLSAPSAQEVAVDYATVDGTAIAPADYLPTSGRLVFPPGATVATVTVPVVSDTVPERRETFSLVLSNPSAGAVIAAGQGVAVILDDDPGGAPQTWLTMALEPLACVRGGLSRCPASAG